jgi:hypothetical protein
MERLQFDVEFIWSHIFRNISHFNSLLVVKEPPVLLQDLFNSLAKSNCVEKVMC